MGFFVVRPYRPGNALLKISASLKSVVLTNRISKTPQKKNNRLITLAIHL